MVMAADPAFGALESVGAEDKRIIYMSPRGEKLSPDKVRELSEEDDIVILCGHYEGVDQRILDYWDAEEISIGDYVLTGGELPAMVLIDAVSRLVPGVLSSVDAATEESVYSGLLEYPQYTRPADYKGLKVPEVLLSGDHKKVDLWRFEQSLILTKKRRPDLFDRFVKNHRKLTKEEYKIMEKVSLLL
jgi:tRNA (guanine37-N1)-methyltransferase